MPPVPGAPTAPGVSEDVSLPPGEVSLPSASGNMSLPSGDVSLAPGSGNVSLAGASGDLSFPPVAHDLTEALSGDVSLPSASIDADVAVSSASDDLSFPVVPHDSGDTSLAGDVSVPSVSGDVSLPSVSADVSLPSASGELPGETDANTVCGKINNRCSSCTHVVSVSIVSCPFLVS